MTVENKGVVVFIPVGIVAVDFYDFGNEAPVRAPLKVQDDVYGVADVCLDREIGKIHAPLQHTTRESSKALPRGSDVYGRKTLGVPGIGGL